MTFSVSDSIGGFRRYLWPVASIPIALALYFVWLMVVALMLLDAPAWFALLLVVPMFHLATLGPSFWLAWKLATYRAPADRRPGLWLRSVLILAACISPPAICAVLMRLDYKAGWEDYERSWGILVLGLPVSGTAAIIFCVVCLRRLLAGRTPRPEGAP